MSDRRRERSLVRPHVVTGGRGRPSRSWVDVSTVVRTSAPAAQSGANLLGSSGGPLSPEKIQVIHLCRGGALAVAEIAAHLGLPTSVIKVLVSDLLDSGHLTLLTATAPDFDAHLLKKVLDGLRALT